MATASSPSPIRCARLRTAQIRLTRRSARATGECAVSSSIPRSFIRRAGRGFFATSRSRFAGSRATGRWQILSTRNSMRSARALIHRAIGDRLACVFVDTGLLRAGERERMERDFAKKLGLSLRIVDASELFISRLEGVLDPEQKRRIIGHTFIDVFEEEAAALGGARFLGQGTLYPDVIESVSFKGPSATIKSHHNVGGLPERMRLELIEPLRELFKDEVREVGRELGIPDAILHRQP